MSQTIATNLVRLRRARGMTQTDVANAIGMLRPNYARMESGRRLPAVYVLYRLADVFEVSADDLRKKLQ